LVYYYIDFKWRKNKHFFEDFQGFKANNAMSYITKIQIEDFSAHNVNFGLISKVSSEVIKKEIVFFDVETSGLSPFAHELIEIGAVKYNRYTNEFEKFESLLKPKRTLCEKNISVHGITNEDLESAPDPQAIVEAFFKFIEGTTLVAYNAQFDIGFLMAEHIQRSLKIEANNVLDALPLVRYTYRNQEGKPENFKLSTLNSYFDLNLKSHRAFDDAVACMVVFLKGLERLDHLNKVKRFNVFDFKKVQRLEPCKKLEKIIKAINEEEDIEIVYKGGSKGRKLRALKPLAILPLPHGTFIYSTCLEDKLNKAFNLKKITEVR